MERIPSPYVTCTKLSADARTCMTFALLIWGRLNTYQQNALVAALRCEGTRRLSTRMPTGRALYIRGLAQEPEGWSKLTPLGLLVREAGTRSRVEVPS